MKYTHLGKTGMLVSRLCLGTMNFGPTTSEEEADRIMDAALDAGINFFDTANMYGFRPDTGFNQRGLTEEIIGRWFSQGGGRREKTVLATKVFAPMNDPNDGPNDTGNLSAYKIRRHLDASLKRLKTDHIELYYMHGYDPDCPWSEIYAAFERAYYQGKIDYVGSSNFELNQLLEAEKAAKDIGFPGIAAEQHRFNLLWRASETDYFPAAMKLGVGIVAFQPLMAGKLSGSLFNGIDKTGRSNKFANNITEQERKQLAAYHKLCGELGSSDADVAQAWVLHNPAVSAVIIGPRTLEQFNDSLRAVELELPEDFLKKLDDIFHPGFNQGHIV
jgi:aryl-alcohol dehydrogenase-like predicted oxidoreductase